MNLEIEIGFEKKEEENLSKSTRFPLTFLSNKSGCIRKMNRKLFGYLHKKGKNVKHFLPKEARLFRLYSEFLLILVQLTCKKRRFRKPIEFWKAKEESHFIFIHK
jgi:hypothetical protein